MACVASAFAVGFLVAIFRGAAATFRAREICNPKGRYPEVARAKPLKFGAALRLGLFRGQYARQPRRLCLPLP